jgi:uncharacterized protein YoxC
MNLNDCTKIFYEVKKENTDIEEKIYRLENIVSGIDAVYDLNNNVSVLRTMVEMLQPSIDSLSGRIDSIESRVTKLETNLGYLIGDFKNLYDGVIGNFDLNKIYENINNLSTSIYSINDKLLKIEEHIENCNCGNNEDDNTDYVESYTLYIKDDKDYVNDDTLKIVEDRYSVDQDGKLK